MFYTLALIIIIGMTFSLLRKPETLLEHFSQGRRELCSLNSAFQQLMSSRKDCALPQTGTLGLDQSHNSTQEYLQQLSDSRAPVVTAGNTVSCRQNEPRKYVWNNC